jgi:pantetheine-phosphate adenylyltransferase
VAVFPGSFDPITNGHIDIVDRALAVFDEVIIAILVNREKKPLFTPEERLGLIRDAFRGQKRVRGDTFSGLLVDYAMRVGASVIIRGLRAVSDFEYEIQMANMNARMEPNIETIFLMASDRHQFIASSLVKDIARLGGDTSQFVSKKVFQRLKEKFKKS